MIFTNLSILGNLLLWIPICTMFCEFYLRLPNVFLWAYNVVDCNSKELHLVPWIWVDDMMPSTVYYSHYIILVVPLIQLSTTEFVYFLQNTEKDYHVWFITLNAGWILLASEGFQDLVEQSVCKTPSLFFLFIISLIQVSQNLVIGTPDQNYRMISAQLIGWAMFFASSAFGPGDPANPDVKLTQFYNEVNRQVVYVLRTKWYMFQAISGLIIQLSIVNLIYEKPSNSRWNGFIHGTTALLPRHQPKPQIWWHKVVVLSLGFFLGTYWLISSSYCQMPLKLQQMMWYEDAWKFGSLPCDVDGLKSWNNFTQH